MKAIVHARFGSPDVLEVREVAKPVPGKNEVLIKVRATTVTTAESRMRQGKPLWGRVVIGLLRPRRRMRTPGTEVAGEIESVGVDVRRFKPGDEVFGFTGFALGGHAEYCLMPEQGSLAPKPVNRSFAEAVAAVDGATTALYFLRDKARVLVGQRVLVNGASGGIGTYAVQLAKHFGAEVTGVCGPGNVELVRSLGADHVVDYTKEDFTRHADTYDVIFDTVGRSSFPRAKPALKKNGRYLSTDGLVNVFWSLWTSARRGKRVVFGMSVGKNEKLAVIKELIEADELRIVVDREYPFARIAEAHRHVDTGHKKGNVVVTVDHPAE
ncbi:NADPH2:quinone reductase [Saccharothrix ecbatanensis]|uniref:NADPH2:quinone reductase n=1 Tax=Saccharothrix ecbatanensis TaxID=1105145 RepID=A0A7W9HP42_9PSEU|nr:NAD(P)-dependent alcohol dehydrogenase [Saccharothrix ecbatanensis]MBB5805852.1 NADPH2:quinone reductase [Saccharothrix ecbatanensis]